MDYSNEYSQPHTRGCPKSVRSLIYLIKADLYRYPGHGSLKFIRNFLFTPGFKYSSVMRTTGYLKTKRWAKLTLLYYFFKLYLLRLRYRFGIAIPEYTVIGPGLMISRFGGIYINGDTVIGSNVNLSPSITIGQSNNVLNRGSPVLGDRISIAMGARMAGSIHIADDTMIGFNAVITKSTEPSSVMVGIPARKISSEGSAAYLKRLWPN